MTSVLRVDEIVVADRVRQDLGDIADLATSIAEVGLLHPVVVDTEHRLIAGARRLAAVRSLGLVEVDVTIATSIADEDAALQAEQQENTCRKDFTPGEAHAMWERRKVVVAAEAKQRQREGAAVRDAKRGTPDLPSIGGKVPRTKDKSSETGIIAAKGTGYGATTLHRVDVVKRAQDDPDPAVAAVARDMSAQLDAGTVKPNAAVRAIDDAKAAAGTPRPRRLSPEQRTEQIRARAATGETSRQIAAAIGVSANHVRLLAKEAGIALADSVVGKSTAIDANRVVTEVVHTLQGTATSLSLISTDDLTIDVAWACTEIDAALAAIRKFHRTLKQGAHQ